MPSPASGRHKGRPLQADCRPCKSVMSVSKQSVVVRCLTEGAAGFYFVFMVFVNIKPPTLSIIRCPFFVMRQHHFLPFATLLKLFRT